jgi:shikimate kinase
MSSGESSGGFGGLIVTEHVKKLLQENGIDMLKLQFEELQQQTHGQPVIPPLHSAQCVNQLASIFTTRSTVESADDPSFFEDHPDTSNAAAASSTAYSKTAPSEEDF